MFWRRAIKSSILNSSTNISRRLNYWRTSSKYGTPLSPVRASICPTNPLPYSGEAPLSSVVNNFGNWGLKAGALTLSCLDFIPTLAGSKRDVGTVTCTNGPGPGSQSTRNLKIVRWRGLISPDKMSGEHKLSTMSGEKFDICRTIYSEMSGENSICPAKDCRFAGQNVQRGSNQFRILCWLLLTTLTNSRILNCSIST